MSDTILETYETLPIHLYTILVLLLLLLRNPSFLLNSLLRGEHVRSTEAHIFEYITENTPWYSTVLFIFPLFSAVLSAATNNKAFLGSFKHVSRSVIGALIG